MWNERSPRKKASNFSEIQRTCNSRKTDVMQRSQWTWFCKPGARLSENKVNGPEDAIVSEMIKSPWRGFYTITKSVRWSLQAHGRW